MAISLLRGAEVPSWAMPCFRCHPQETARYTASKMGNSVRAPAERPAGEVMHQASGSIIRIEQRNGRMFQLLSEKGLSGEYAIDYEIGAGLAGGSYLIRLGDHLFQSPVSWYNSHGWDVSPGYQNLPVLDFNRPINSACLLCHTGNTRFQDPDGRKPVNAALVPITCERCHGPVEKHLRLPVPGSIINPRKLTGSIRESVCAQCHLEGEARVLNPGKTFSDFHPGVDLSDVWAVYVNRDAEAAANVVNHFEQLAESRCWRESGGRMWCGTCHDPHGAPADRPAQVRVICTSCHSSLSKEAHPVEPASCLSCHMPRLPASDVPHTAITDHRILRRPTPPAAPGIPRSIGAWKEPPAEYRDRDLGIAEIAVGTQRQVPELIEAGSALLDRITSSPTVHDPPALSAMGGVLMSRGRPWGAVALGRRAAEQQPNSAAYALDLGVYLATAGDLLGAERELSRAIELDPSFDRPYKALFDVEGRQNRIGDAIATLDRYLKQNPRSIEFRAQRAAVAGGE